MRSTVDFKETERTDLAAIARDMRSGARPRRVMPVRIGGRNGWLKIALDEGWRKRIGRGAPGKALLRELAVIESRRAAGVPVPEVLAEGPGFLVLADCGPTLAMLFADHERHRAERLRAFAAAGAMLAGLHRRGTGHGRGKIKDFCWDGAAIRMIDFESVRPHYEPQRDAHREIVTFVHHSHFVAMVHGVQPTEELRVFQRAYRAAGGGEVLERAQHWARRRWWLGSLSAPVGFLTARNRANDLKAILPALAVLAYFLFEN